MKITVMWMTRKRSHELIYSLSSFIHKANDNKNVEYIIALDSDDDEHPIRKKVKRMSVHFLSILKTSCLFFFIYSSSIIEMW